MSEANTNVLLECCPRCNTWHMLALDYYKCSKCGCETFTHEWMMSHPEHPQYNDYIKFKKGEENNGQNIEPGI